MLWRHLAPLKYSIKKKKKYFYKNVTVVVDEVKKKENIDSIAVTANNITFQA